MAQYFAGVPGKRSVWNALPANTHAHQPQAAACPTGFSCTTVRVPLDHFDPKNKQQIDVTFAVLPATDKKKRKGMFVTAVGGPGSSGLQSAASYAESYGDAIHESFDIVFFDQRGIGASGGFNCEDAVTKYYRTDGRAKTPEQERALIAAARTFAAECLKTLPTDKLKFYGTRQAVEDLDVFRQRTGDDKLWLYGESYGTQFAQWYAAAHPNRVAEMVLDGVVDLTLDGPQFSRDATRTVSDVLAATLAACNADAACKRDVGGDALKAYDALAAQLDRAPATLNFPLPDGKQAKRTLTLSDLETAMVTYLYTEGERMLIQRAVASAARGDLVPMARLSYNALGLDPQTLHATPDPSYSDAAYFSVTCNDYEYFTGTPDQRAEQFVRAGDAVDRSVPRMNSTFYGDLPCAFWPRTEPVPKYKAGLATLIPTLVLVATADPATPAAQGRAVFKRLSNAYLVTTQGGAHVTFGRGNACPDDIVTSFVVSDTLPARAETQCDGVLARDYVPIAPADAKTFANALDALASAENEIVYAPEYYGWDGSGDDGIGCAQGGTAAWHAGEKLTSFTLTQCSFSRGFVMSGDGTYDAVADRWTFDVAVSGDHTGKLSYVREGDSIKVTGTLGGKPVSLSR